MDTTTRNIVINYAQLISIKSSIETNVTNDDYIERIQSRESDEENSLHDEEHEETEETEETEENDENVEKVEISKSEEALLEQVWWHFKPPTLMRQSPTVSTRQVQVTRQRLLPTMKKPPNLVGTLRDRVQENLKQQRR